MVKKLTGRTSKVGGKRPQPISSEALGDKPEKEEGKCKAPISSSISENFDHVKNLFKNADDVIVREFVIGQEPGVKAFLLAIDGMVDKDTINASIINPLTFEARLAPPKVESNAYFLGWIKEHTLSMVEMKEEDDMEKAIYAALSGDSVLFIDGYTTALILGTRGWINRGVQESTTETVIRGSKESFTETLRINTSLLRRRIKDTNLKFETMALGERTKTGVTLVYLDGLVNPKIIDEVKKRLKEIKTDSILETQYIEEFIQDAPLSPFLTVHRTERPDSVAAKLLEGRFAILVDGTPTVLTAPTLMAEFFMSSEDYYVRPYFATLNRWLRFIAFAITLLFPALYVAVANYHQELIPTPLLITMAATKEGTPFPTVVEAFIMGLAFEVLREAGVRMPRAIGAAVSIVGALILGEAAVSAGLTSTPMIIVVAITGISVFVFPSPDFAFSLIPIRVGLVVAAALFGIFGVIMGILILLIHLTTLRSFGVPFLSPVAPAYYEDFKDFLVRVPWWAMRTRPHLLAKDDPVRQAKGLLPSPPPPNTKESGGQGTETEENEGSKKGEVSEQKPSGKPTESENNGQ